MDTSCTYIRHQRWNIYIIFKLHFTFYSRHVPICIINIIKIHAYVQPMSFSSACMHILPKGKFLLVVAKNVITWLTVVEKLLCSQFDINNFIPREKMRMNIKCYYITCDVTTKIICTRLFLPNLNKRTTSFSLLSESKMLVHINVADVKIVYFLH